MSPGWVRDTEPGVAVWDLNNRVVYNAAQYSGVQ